MLPASTLPWTKNWQAAVLSAALPKKTTMKSDARNNGTKTNGLS